MSDRTYEALSTFGTIFYILGIVLLIIGILSGLFYIFTNFWTGLIIIIVTVLISLPLMAFSNFVDLLINLEENTYSTAKYLKELVHGKEKFPKVSKTGYICTKCNSEVGDTEVHCKTCKALLGADGAVKKIKKVGNV